MSVDVRKYTNLFLELCDEGALSWQSLAEMALSYMSEDDVEDMFHCNDLDEFDPDRYDDEDDEDEDYSYDDDEDDNEGLEEDEEIDDLEFDPGFDKE